MSHCTISEGIHPTPLKGLDLFLFSFETTIATALVC